MGKTKIGRFCSIAQNVRTCIGRHPVSNFVSTHPAFFSKQKLAGFTYVDENQFQEHTYIDAERRFVVEIGNDVWIGNNVMVMDGVRIGDGAVIGSGSIVTKDVEPYSINVGIPAKKIRYRFEKRYIDFLLEFKWWNKGFKWVEDNAHLFSNVEKLYEEYR
ncbi:CatB-related O-acetyltransferase [Elusimicrobiota bacterium]